MKINKFISLLLLAALLLNLCPWSSLTVQAADAGIQAGAPMTAGDMVYFGKYPQSVYTPVNVPGSPNDGEIYIDTDGTEFIYKDSSYYKIEPIQWRVLSNTGGELFLLAGKNLDCKQYHEDNESITWERSTIRSWLNGYVAAEHNGSSGTDYSITGANFIDLAFNDKEQEVILTTNISNPNNPSYNTPGGNNTNDKVFLLSTQEAATGTYGFNYFSDNNSRVSENTDYAIAAGADDTSGNGFWWLRSPGYGNNAAYVNYAGVVYVTGSEVYKITYTAHPALNLDLTSVIFTSSAVDGKSVAAAGSGLKLTEPAGAVLKLTVQDTGTAPPVLTFAGTTNGTDELRFGYEGAKTGINQYVSCVLEDSGTIKYYGKLANCTAAAGENGIIAIDTSTLAQGTYDLKIFCEQANDDYCTDFAGTSEVMTLTVDSSGNGTINNFSGQIDSTAPTVTVMPGNTSVAQSTANLALAFSEKIDINTAGMVTMLPNKVNGTPNFTNMSMWNSPANTLLTIALQTLDYSETYTIDVSGFRDFAGNAMTDITGHTFTTEAQGVAANPVNKSSGGTNPVPAPEPFPFVDVVSGDWYYDDVKTVYNMGLINGVTHTLYVPEGNLTNAEAVKLAACMHQLYITGKVTLQKGNPWYKTYADYAKQNGIITADYVWNAPATRAGCMEIFARALPDKAYGAVNEIPDGAIPDVPMNLPQADAIYKLYRAGIIKSVDSARNCAPAANIKRSEVAAILTRMMIKDARIKFSI